MWALLFLGCVPLIILALVVYENGWPALLGAVFAIAMLGTAALVVWQRRETLLRVDWVTPALVLTAVLYGMWKLRSCKGVDACSATTTPATGGVVARLWRWGSGGSRVMVARHEAGHAVAAIHYGVKVKGMRIGSGNNVEWGYTAFSGSKPSRAKMADITIAGAVCEAAYVGTSVPKALNIGKGQEGSDHWWFQEEAGGGSSTVSKHTKRVSAIIRDDDPRITDLATALARHGKLSGSEVRNIVKKASKRS